MSIFADILRQAIENLPGARGAVFADWEGEAVDAYSNVGKTQIRLIGAHWGVIYNQARAAFKKLRLGPIRQLILRFSEESVIIRRITDEYFVVVNLGREGNLGQTLHALDSIEHELREQM